MSPPRSLRTASSQISACSDTLATSIVSKARPAVLARSLWQETQYEFRKVRSGLAVGASWIGVGARGARGALNRAVPSAPISSATQPPATTANRCTFNLRFPLLPLFHLHDSSDLAHVEPEAAVARSHEQLRVAPPRVEGFGRTGSEHLVGAHALPHHLDERIAGRGEHVVLRLQVGARLHRSLAGDDTRLGVGKTEQRLRCREEA